MDIEVTASPVTECILPRRDIVPIFHHREGNRQWQWSHLMRGEGAAQLRAEGSRRETIRAMTISLGSGFGGGIIPRCMEHTHVSMAGGRPSNHLMSNNAQNHQQYQFTKAASFLPTY